MNVTERHTFKHYADQSVISAMQLVSKLPNGWKLVSFTYETEARNNLLGKWIAVVESPERPVDFE